MRQAMIVLTLVLLVLPGCSSALSIVGEWERYGDEFEGMRVKVEELDDGTYRGTITKADAAGEFKEGDVKWYEIKRISDGTFDLNDVGTAAELYKSTIRLEGSDELKMRELVDSGAVVGTNQTWKRVKE